MSYSFNELTKRIEETTEWFLGELSGIRTGRATTSFLDDIRITAYGSEVPLEQVASLSVEDPKTIRVSPWDSSHISAIEKAIVDADRGVSASSDEKGVRVHFPQLTEETRAKIAKVAKEKLEDARVAVRNTRDEIWSDIQKKEKDGEMSEDEKFRLKDEMQKHIDGANEKLLSLYEKKEKEILG